MQRKRTYALKEDKPNKNKPKIKKGTENEEGHVYCDVCDKFIEAGIGITKTSGEPYYFCRNPNDETAEKTHGEFEGKYYLGPARADAYQKYAKQHPGPADIFSIINEKLDKIMQLLTSSDEDGKN